MALPGAQNSAYREEHFAAAVQLNGSNLDLLYLLSVVAQGKFVLASAFAEGMYRPGIRGIGTTQG